MGATVGEGVSESISAGVAVVDSAAMDDDDVEVADNSAGSGVAVGGSIGGSGDAVWVGVVVLVAVAVAGKLMATTVAVAVVAFKA